ncbi:MAG: cell division ATP-binding protein FtsE [Lachnospiraceae bacterium]|nr:cell division ATP-binding protein FtsE [Lachnospiraceae bacterium]
MIRFNKVSLKYDKDTYAVQDLSLKIEEGEFVFIVGKTGAGKSTLFKLLTRELKPTSGSIKVFKDNIEYISNKNIPYYRRKLGVVFQDFKLLEDRNVYENVAFAQEVIGVNAFKIKKHVIKILNLVGLRNKATKMPYELSGGEKQKVAIARAIINKPKILLADEPTGNLDEMSTNEIIGLLNTINQNGTTVIIITHDMHLVERMNKRVIRLDEGNLVYDDYGLDNQIKNYLKNE